VATTFCELYSLSRMDLEEVLQQWPELAREFEALGESLVAVGAQQAPSAVTLGQRDEPCALNPAH